MNVRACVCVYVCVYVCEVVCFDKTISFYPRPPLVIRFSLWAAETTYLCELSHLSKRSLPNHIYMFVSPTLRIKIKNNFIFVNSPIPPIPSVPFSTTFTSYFTRLHHQRSGTKVDEARELIAKESLKIITCDDFDKAAKMVSGVQQCCCCCCCSEHL